MIYPYAVKHNGFFYRPGENVPDDVKDDEVGVKSQPLPFEPEPENEPETEKAPAPVKAHNGGRAPKVR